MTPSLKYYFYVAVFVLALQAHRANAYENDSPQGRQNYEQNYLDRLHFRTPGQDLLSTFDFTPDILNDTVTTSNGVQTNQSMKDRFPISLGETLGITDLLSIGITEGYLFHSTQTNINDVTGVQSSPSSSGFSDPTFRANYRYFGSLVGSNFGDAFINFSPSVGDNQGASTSQNGNNLRGDTSFELGTDFYHVADSNEFSVGGSWLTYTSKNVDSANSINDEVGANFSSFDVRLRYRYHLNEFVFVQAQGTLYMPYSASYTYYNSTNNRAESDSYPFYAVPRVTLGYLPTNFVLYSLGVYYTGYTRNYTTSTNTSSSSNTAVYHEVTLDFGVSFLL
jgi:hypothetical protein